MIFQHTIDKVLSLEKTQTRRLVKPGEYQRRDFVGGELRIVQVAHTRDEWVGTDSRVVYNLGSTYAVQPGRGLKSVARIEIVEIRREDVRQISDEDVRAEGFNSVGEFLALWAQLHDPSIGLYWESRINSYMWKEPGARSFRKEVWDSTASEYLASALLKCRPAANYDAWALTFKLVEAVTV